MNKDRDVQVMDFHTLLLFLCECSTLVNCFFRLSVLIKEDGWLVEPLLFSSPIKLISSVSLSFLRPASFPVHGWMPPSPAGLSLSSVDETTERMSSSRAGDKHQWMVSYKYCRIADMVLYFMSLSSQWHENAEQKCLELSSNEKSSSVVG